MAINRDLLNNDVPAAHQVSELTKIYDGAEGAPRVLFLGNSITLHEPAPHIGWNNSWGMAASAEDKDYVHLVLKGLNARLGTVNYCIANVAGWARDYENDEKRKEFDAARDFDADVVIVRFGENVDQKTWDPARFALKMREFLAYLVKPGAKMIFTDLFWESTEMDAIFAATAKDLGQPFVSICDLGYDDANKAIGLFEHSGVALHPGDLGMARIAERILAAFDEAK